MANFSDICGQGKERMGAHGKASRVKKVLFYFKMQEIRTGLLLTGKKSSGVAKSKTQEQKKCCHDVLKSVTEVGMWCTSRVWSRAQIIHLVK